MFATAMSLWVEMKRGGGGSGEGTIDEALSFLGFLSQLRPIGGKRDTLCFFSFPFFPKIFF